MARIKYRRIRKGQVVGDATFADLFDNDKALDTAIDSLAASQGSTDFNLVELSTRVDALESRVTVTEGAVAVAQTTANGAAAAAAAAQTTANGAAAAAAAAQSTATAASAKADTAQNVASAAASTAAAASAVAATAQSTATEVLGITVTQGATLVNHEGRIRALELGGGGGGGGGSSGSFFEANCIESLKAGDLVSPGGVGVRRANPYDLTSMPAVGIVVSKPSPTVARVQTAGVVFDVVSGLVMGQTYFVGMSSEPVSTPPVAPPDAAQQRIGVALSSSVLLLTPSTEMFIDS